MLVHVRATCAAQATADASADELRCFDFTGIGGQWPIESPRQRQMSVYAIEHLYPGIENTKPFTPCQRTHARRECLEDVRQQLNVRPLLGRAGFRAEYSLACGHHGFSKRNSLSLRESRHESPDCVCP